MHLRKRFYSLKENEATEDNTLRTIERAIDELKKDMSGEALRILENWESEKAAFRADTYTYKVRGKDIHVKTHTESLSGTEVPKIALPGYQDWGDILSWHMQENLPGEFPFTAGVFPFKRKGEDPTRMFAGEGGPERTNKRFHYVIGRSADKQAFYCI